MNIGSSWRSSRREPRPMLEVSRRGGVPARERDPTSPAALLGRNPSTFGALHALQLPMRTSSLVSLRAERGRVSSPEGGWGWVTAAARSESAQIRHEAVAKPDRAEATLAGDARQRLQVAPLRPHAEVPETFAKVLSEWQRPS